MGGVCQKYFLYYFVMLNEVKHLLSWDWDPSLHSG
jgi:hypothetical protein